VRHLVAAEGVSVLWATHLIDEVADGDDVIVLHHGRVLAHGAVANMVRTLGVPDMRAAFTRLTQECPSQTESQAS
jgi:ABC-2 type transport system ATP-binding protein